MIDSCKARKLEAQLDGNYLMSKDLITSTMKSEPGMPAPCPKSGGTPVSAKAPLAEGGKTEGLAGAAACAGLATSDAAVPAAAAPEAKTPLKKASAR